MRKKDALCASSHGAGRELVRARARVDVVEELLVARLDRTKLDRPGQLRGGKTPWSAMQKLSVRYGCMLLCGCSRPAVASADRASANARPRRGGHASRNDDLRARTASLMRTVNTERGDIDTDTTGAPDRQRPPTEPDASTTPFPPPPTGGGTPRANPASPAAPTRRFKPKSAMRGSSNGPAWTRTRDQRIMSPLL
jgi:hypothetical protein